MRILQLVTRNELRGAEVFAGQLSEELSRRGHRVLQAGLYRLRDDSALLDLNGVELVHLSGRRQGRIQRRPLLELASLIDENSIELIHANGFHALKYSCLLAKVGRVRAPIVYRNISLASQWARHPLRQVLGRWLCQSLSLASSVSEAAAADFSRFYSFPRDRVQVIRRGIEVPERVDPKVARNRLLDAAKINRNALAPDLVAMNAERRTEAENTRVNDQRLICHVGGFTPEKNHRGLLQAFAQIHREVPNCHLLLFGDGPLRCEIEAHIEQIRLRDSVHLMGFRHDARDLVAGCDVMLLTSHIEGVPGAVLEAAARFVPSVCTSVGSVGEFVEHGKTGYLAAGGDMESVAGLTIALLNDENRRQQIGESARDRVREEYGMPRATDQFVSLFERALASGYPA